MMTVTARAFGSGPLLLVPCSAGLRMSHLLRLPGGACPVSSNPIGALLLTRYTAGAGALEVVTLRAVILSAWANPPPGAQSVEGFAAHVAALVRASGVHPESVTLWALVRPGPQILCVRA